MNKITTLFLIAFAATLLTGCDESPNPKPRDTILGSKKYTKSRPDWIDENFAYSEEGLSPRNNNSRTKATKELRHQVAQKNLSNKNSNDAIYFEYDNSSIQAQEREKLANVAKKLKSNPKAELLVVGRCDYHGTQEYNLALGDRRARSVNNYLTQLGVSKNQIKTLSKGSLEARANAEEKIAALDRRSDLVLTN